MAFDANIDEVPHQRQSHFLYSPNRGVWENEDDFHGVI